MTGNNILGKKFTKELEEGISLPQQKLVGGGWRKK
jgi:hypothetical protein